MNILELEGVCWQRGEQTLLSGVDWTVKRGEHWAILGPNGAGKTALIHIITGYTWPTEGSVTVLQKKFGEYPLQELRRSIGWISPSLAERFDRHHRNESALRVVISGKRATIGVYERVADREVEEAMELLRRFGCEDLASKPFVQLSQGEKQRVLLARAWMAKPALLMMDEPGTGLDIRARESLLRSLQVMGEAEEGPTILYITHHAEEIVPVIQHVLLLKEGRILAKGEKHRILTDQQMSRVFGVPLQVTWQQDRPWIRLRS
ncbi:iron complex transport system ATP-binding protein [Melghirimyces profundicolus]|uniref:Iron complex transport system ATP-binding protein n=1 Tax=Melghirimyces profundicolus TaxID=1242148 RepID=A0A2T6C8I1_9BACL|nr:ABC transporter ATP-binding protein [Melghirimyces profundicolus]PTX64615.1 iron complex transport system ATP-binding protein [Melghirimyces profundicolus]